MKLLNRRRDQQLADAVIASPEEHTVIDESGAVRSIQAADVTLPAEELESIWSPMHLERLARTYWRYLSRVTLGLIRVEYSSSERAVVLLTRPFVLLRFHPPEYDMSGARGIVRWRIRDGILVAQPDHGHLEIDVRRLPSEEPGREQLHIEVEVASFYPAIATWVARWFYRQTQSRIHVLVTHGFLRSLAKLELEESAVGRFAAYGPAPRTAGDGTPAGAPPPAHAGNGHVLAAAEETVTIGETPWPAVLALAAAMVLGAVTALLWLRRQRG
jgi:hypothetical protein